MTMELKDFAVQVLLDRLGTGTKPADASAALDELTGGDNGFDLGEIVAKFTSSRGDLADMGNSWLGDGANRRATPIDIEDALGSRQLESFAKKLGIERAEASQGLSDMLPELIDKCSYGGNLIGKLNDDGGIAGLARKLFG